MSKLQKTIEENKARLEELQEQANTLREELKSRQLKDELDQQKKRKGNLKDSLDNSSQSAHNRTYQNELQRVKERIKSIQSELEELPETTREIEEIEEDLKSVQEEIQNLEIQNLILQKAHSLTQEARNYAPLLELILSDLDDIPSTIISPLLKVWVDIHSQLEEEIASIKETSAQDHYNYFEALKKAGFKDEQAMNILLKEIEKEEPLMQTLMNNNREQSPSNSRYSAIKSSIIQRLKKSQSGGGIQDGSSIF